MPTTPRRLHPDTRRQQILDAALQLAVADGYLSFTRDSVARAVGVSPALISRYFFATHELRRHVMLRAIAGRELAVVAQGLAVGDVTALAASGELRAAAALTLAGV